MIKWNAHSWLAFHWAATQSTETIEWERNTEENFASIFQNGEKELPSVNENHLVWILGIIVSFIHQV